MRPSVETTRGSVATGVAVPPLLLDDDPLVVAGVVRWLHHFLVLLAFSLRVGRDAHARLVGLCERMDVSVEKLSLKDFWIAQEIETLFLYLHRVDDDGESGVVPLAAALLRAAPGTFTTSMDRANSEHAEDYHDHQETHAHHDDDGGCSRHHWRKIMGSGNLLIFIHYTWLKTHINTSFFHISSQCKYNWQLFTWKWNIW